MWNPAPARSTWRGPRPAGSADRLCRLVVACSGVRNVGTVRPELTRPSEDPAGRGGDRFVEHLPVQLDGPAAAGPGPVECVEDSPGLVYGALAGGEGCSGRLDLRRVCERLPAGPGNPMGSLMPWHCLAQK